ncbi:hypothetical protein ACQJBY_018793 [Aegilops geniculata]
MPSEPRRQITHARRKQPTRDSDTPIYANARRSILNRFIHGARAGVFDGGRRRWRGAAVRERLRVLRERGGQGHVLKVLPRPPQGRRCGCPRRRGEAHVRRPHPRLQEVDERAGLYRGTGGGGGSEEVGAKQVHGVQEEGGAAGVRVPVRWHLLLAAPVRGRARMRLRLQEGRPGADRAAEPSRRAVQAP